MNREEAPGKSPEDMYIQQKVRVLLMLKKMGSNVSIVQTGPAGWFSHFKFTIIENCLILAFSIIIFITFTNFDTFY